MEIARFRVDTKREKVFKEAEEAINKKQIRPVFYITFISILSVCLLLMAFAVFALYKRYIASARENQDLRKQIVMASNVKSNLQAALKKAVRTKRDYKDSLAQETARSREKDARIAALNLEINNLTGRAYALEQKAGGLYRENNSLNQQLNFSKRVQENLQKKINRLLTRTKVDLGEVVIKPSSLMGTILKVNRKYNFVIVDLGKNDGLKTGANLIIYRQQTPITEINIETVYDELSVGKVISEWPSKGLEVGDTVKGKN